jgi:dTDP-4-amino-4,6-dideoxygalactose transaminase
MNKHVPFLDLITPHLVDEVAMLNVCREALRTGRFIGGPMVEEFEQEFAAFCNAKYCVGVGSGTDALRFGMIAAGIRSGDIVITVPNTFIATTEAISQAGATPMFIDIDPQTSTMDPKRLQRFLESQCETMKLTGETAHLKTGRRVSAVVPVHLYGQTADMDAIRDIAERYRLIVIEDACQSHGAEYYSKRDGRWRKAGSMGAAAAFSFYPGKNLGACGEAGALTTNDEAIAGTVRMLRDHGQSKKYVHEMEGYNGRLDAIQAGFLQVKLKRLHAWNEQRRKHANRYTALLQGLDGVMTPVEPGWCRGVYHLYVIRTRERDALQKYLLDRNIVTGLHYPIPLHLQKAYAGYDFAEGDFPESEAASRELLSLPMFPGLTEEQQDLVVNAIRSFPPFCRADARQGEPASPQVFSRDPAGAVPLSAGWTGKGIAS